MAESEVKNIYKGANIFITGATGFLGVALIEKLLSATQVNKIYLLIRTKEDMTIEKRMEEITNNLVFETLVGKVGRDIFSKLVAVCGDVTKDGLGLSAADRKMIQDDANFVFHSAAVIDFCASFRDTMTNNLLGTRNVVALCKSCSKLKSLVFVSSASANTDKDHILREILYPPPADADQVIKMLGSFSDAELEAAAPGVLKKHPSAYTFSKALEEYEVSNSSGSFPSAIVRPSLITNAWKSPVPGWTCSDHGIPRIMMGAAMGVVRRFPTPSYLVCDYIPVDVVANQIIVAGWFTAKCRPSSSMIYHVTTSTVNPFRWSCMEPVISKILHKYPLSGAVWYPRLKLVPSMTHFHVAAILFHLLPAYVLDALTRLTGGQPVLVRLHANICAVLDHQEKFIFKEWFFDNTNTQELSKVLTESDREEFFFDVTTLKWGEYFTNMIQGVRRYLWKEGRETLPAARRRDRILFGCHLALQASLLGLVWYLFSFAVDSSFIKTCWIILPTYLLFTML